MPSIVTVLLSDWMYGQRGKDSATGPSARDYP
jgi:hypothetical protein